MDESKPKSLKDDDIVTVRVDRRSFLAKVGLGGAMVAAAIAIPACGKKSDDCDDDPSDPCSIDND